jgi:prepilin-type N-terminal cleavage/methylation domain-containing protein
MEKKGFTILEMLLSVAMIAILAGVSIPLYSIYGSRTSSEGVKNGITNSLRTARAFSVAGKDDSAWGVHFESGNIIIFKGFSFAGRDASFDETMSIDDDVTFSGINNIYFNAAGVPDKTGDVTFTIPNYGSNSVTLISEGIIY